MKKLFLFLLLFFGGVNIGYGFDLTEMPEYATGYTYTHTYTISASYNINDIDFNANGTKSYMLYDDTSTTTRIQECTLTTAWDISTKTSCVTRSFLTTALNGKSGAWSKSVMYFDSTNNYLYLTTLLSTTRYITKLTCTSDSLNTCTYSKECPSGSATYPWTSITPGSGTDKLLLSRADSSIGLLGEYDIDACTWTTKDGDANYSYSTIPEVIGYFYFGGFNEDGTKVFTSQISGAQNNGIYEYNLSSAYDLTTMTTTANDVWLGMTGLHDSDDKPRYKFYDNFTKVLNFSYDVDGSYDGTSTIYFYDLDTGPTFSYFTSGYTNLADGFIYHNFIPDTEFYGGDLYFKITKSGSTTFDLTNSYGPDYYGFDTSIQIKKDPYFMYGTGTYTATGYYIAYTPEYAIYELDSTDITIDDPLLIGDIEQPFPFSGGVFEWDLNSDGSVSVNEWYEGIGNSISEFFQGMERIYNNLIAFFRELSKFGTDEQKVFGFFDFIDIIPEANATNLSDSFNGNDTQDPDNPLTKFRGFLVAFSMMLILMGSLGLFILIRK